MYRQHDYLGAVRSTLVIDMAHTYKLKPETQVAGKVVQCLLHVFSGNLDFLWISTIPSVHVGYIGLSNEIPPLPKCNPNPTVRPIPLYHVG